MDFVTRWLMQHGNFESAATSKKIMADVGICGLLEIVVHLL
jgi:hypothetical protein